MKLIKLRKSRCVGSLVCPERLENRDLLSLTVNTLVDESDGNLDDGDISLRDAIELAEVGELIDFDASLDAGSIRLTLGQLQISKPLVIDARSLSRGLVIDASASDPTPHVHDGNGVRVFEINSDSQIENCDPDFVVELHGLTLMGGDVSAERAFLRGGGGAIHSCENLLITSSTIIDNASDRGSGGGVYSVGDLTIRNSEVSNNFNDHASGGGVFGKNAVTIIDSRIANNRSGEVGGGVGATDLVIESSVIEGNSLRSASGAGGGAFGFTSTHVIGSTIRENSIRAARGRGGGIGGFNVTVLSSTISNNRIQAASAEGGGVSGTDVTIISSTVSGNHAGSNQGLGGGVAGWNIVIRHSTVFDNSSTREGGGVYIQHVNNRRLTLELDNSIVAGNRGVLRRGQGFVESDFYTDANAYAVSASFSLIGNGQTALLPAAPIGSPDENGNLIGTSSTPIDPKLSALVLNGGSTATHSPLHGSPAIDSGDAGLMTGEGSTPSADQRGDPFVRITDGRIDIGAVELQIGPGDFNADYQINVEDIDSLCMAIQSGDNNQQFDLDMDGNLSTLDLDLFLGDVIHSVVGDVNLDGRFNSNDLVAIFTRGKFGSDASWSEGDWNCDGKFDSADLVFAFQQRVYQP